jgi:hypothetical protein
MRDLARETGGRYYQVDNMASTEPFSQVAEELRRQYSMGYYPKRPLGAGQRREIKVKMRLPGLVARSRDSYMVDTARAKAK